MIPKTQWAKTTDGAYIAYQDFGEGPVTLVVIDGWITHLEVSWEQSRFVRFMQRFARGMRILLFDKRGTGKSDRFSQALDLETRMDDVRAVMDAADVEWAALLGWDDGGPPLAAFFAATHPERTVALCIDHHIQARWTPDYPFGETEDNFEERISEWMAVWGVGCSDPPDPDQAGFAGTIYLVQVCKEHDPDPRRSMPLPWPPGSVPIGQRPRRYLRAARSG